MAEEKRCPRCRHQSPIDAKACLWCGYQPGQPIVANDLPLGASTPMTQTRPSLRLVGAAISAIVVVAFMGSALFWTWTTPVRADVMAPLYRAMKHVDSSTKVGINYAAFGEVIRSLSTEHDILRSRELTEDEREIVARAGRALEAYRDSLAIWGSRITRKWDPVSEPGIPDNPIVALALKYKTPGRDAMVGGRKTFDLDLAVQLAWLAGSKELTPAMAAYDSGIDGSVRPRSVSRVAGGPPVE